MKIFNKIMVILISILFLLSIKVMADTNTLSDNSVQANDDKKNVSLLTTTNIRCLPSILSEKQEQLAEGTNVTITAEMNNWIQITDGVVSGWVIKKNLNIPENNANFNDANENKVQPENKIVENKVENTVSNTVNKTTENKVTNEVKRESTSVSKTGKVNVETAKVRKEPDKSSGLVDLLDENDIVTVLEENGEWYKIRHGEIEGYISKKLITIVSDDKISSRNLTEEREDKAQNVEKQTTQETEQKAQTSDVSNQIVEYAKALLGTKYVVGGKTPESGFDCSGFTRYVFKNFGKTLSSTASGQVDVGNEVARENLKPGDLILFYNEEKSKIGHTGIYIGNGEFIHAANPKRGVVIDSLNTSTYYNERYVTARRVVE